MDAQPAGPTEPAMADALDELAPVSAGLAVITVVLFPLALPIIALTALLVLPFVAVGLVAGLLAAPIALARRLKRHERTSR